jgi:hypothetical protein
MVVVRGTVPAPDSNLPGQNQFQLKINGVEVGQKTNVAGQFEIRVIIPPNIGIQKLELNFSNSWLLPSTSHPASARLTFVGFE